MAGPPTSACAVSWASALACHVASCRKNEGQKTIRLPRTYAPAPLAHSLSAASGHSTVMSALVAISVIMLFSGDRTFAAVALAVEWKCRSSALCVALAALAEGGETRELSS